MPSIGVLIKLNQIQTRTNLGHKQQWKENLKFTKNCLMFSKIVDVIMMTCKKETKQVLLCPRMMQCYCTYTYTEAAASSTAVLSAVHSISLQILERVETRQFDFKK